MSGPTATVWIDGGARGNPGPAGCGVVIDLGDGRREEHTLYVGAATNNVAEYLGLIAALERAIALAVESISVHSDSELLVRQLKGVYRVKAPHLVPLWRRARHLSEQFRTFSIGHVRREANRDADRLANVAMDTAASTLPLPDVAR